MKPEHIGDGCAVFITEVASLFPILFVNDFSKKITKLLVGFD